MMWAGHDEGQPHSVIAELMCAVCWAKRTELWMPSPNRRLTAFACGDRFPESSQLSTPSWGRGWKRRSCCKVTATSLWGDCWVRRRSRERLRRYRTVYASGGKSLRAPMDQRETTGRRLLIGSFVMTILLNNDLCVKRGCCVCCTRLYLHISMVKLSVSITPYVFACLNRLPSC